MNIFSRFYFDLLNLNYQNHHYKQLDWLVLVAVVVEQLLIIPKIIHFFKIKFIITGLLIRDNSPRQINGFNFSISHTSLKNNLFLLSKYLIKMIYLNFI